MNKFLVTGGGGFVGRHMIDALLAKKKSVRVLDNFSCSSRKAFIRDYGKPGGLVEGEIR